MLDVGSGEESRAGELAAVLVAGASTTGAGVVLAALSGILVTR